MDAAFDLKPAIHEPLVFVERLAEGPRSLRWEVPAEAQRTLTPEELKKLRAKE